MTDFREFLASRLKTGGFTTEDVLASFLPLAREVSEAHQAGLVGPLDGIDDLRVAGVQIWFEEAQRKRPKPPTSQLRRLEQNDLAAVHVVRQASVETDVDDGRQRIVDLAIGSEAQEVTRPAYFPGFRAWEHLVDCHDPLSDTFCLGMILASLACGLDFEDESALVKFVEHRGNLFRLEKHLHPVLARVIVSMTEVERRRRAQDLPSLIATLENYRDQDVEFEFELAQLDALRDGANEDKQSVILTKLRERLFEISRRNRLLHFRPTLQSVNLTHASVPLSFDVNAIRPDQILIWNDDFQDRVSRGKEISLNKYLNFAEALYLPGQFERLIAESRRDRSEFGFAQLRLVVCFLHWSNLKEQPAEQFDSPFILLPVELRKRKGLRDTFYLKALNSEAEVNPVVRHQFQQLYAIDLPESIDLDTTSMNEFFAEFASQTESSEAAVQVARIDRPRIQLIHETARRKLDQYRRRARLAGKGVRSFLELEYSYDPANYHPLGIRIFSSKVRPSETHLNRLLDENPRPRSFAMAGDGAAHVERQRQFYKVDAPQDVSPYEWSVDFCSVTLANFKYRRMSLVRDYETLLANGTKNRAFDDAFSLEPRKLDKLAVDVRSLDQRFDVVACDPTQAAAISTAASGESFIIQGPPGTGKSQTITNLIADYVARGKRVLFVCEKRAAIDVVYARLRQCGLESLCCLIHDSQADKKKFVHDLKETYETYVADFDSERNVNVARSGVVRELQHHIIPIERFDELMRSEPDDIGISVRRLLDRCIALRDIAPEIDPLVEEQLPTHGEWLRSRAAIGRLQAALGGDETALVHHPVGLLAPRLVDEDRPSDVILTAVEAACQQLEIAKTRLQDSRFETATWQPFRNARALAEYFARLLPLANHDRLQLLDSARGDGRWFDEQRNRVIAFERCIGQAEQSNEHWRMKLTPNETDLALTQALEFDGAAFAFLQPRWWRLRQAMNRCYDFAAHTIRPSWVAVLQQLRVEHDARLELHDHFQMIADRLAVDAQGAEQVTDLVRDLLAWLPIQPEWIQDIHRDVLALPAANQFVVELGLASDALSSASEQLERITDDGIDARTIDELLELLHEILDKRHAIRDLVDALGALKSLPKPVADALRSLALTPLQVEAAVSHGGIRRVLAQHNEAARFTAETRLRSTQRMARLYRQWMKSNAAAVCDRVRERFHESLRLAVQPASGEKEFKRRYNRGRRELEHEFGKQMRYKAIRDLVADETGDVVKDLKPVWLMSPLSVSDTLPLEADRFDVVVFDEASQITLEEAVPALFRAPQAIIVGDEMQLPPTDFFSAKRSSEEEEELRFEAEGELVQYDLDSGSFLGHAAKNLKSALLGWHYRSRSESLISFSNWKFYGGRLLTVPEELLAGIPRDAIVVSTAEDGARGARDTLTRQISFHKIANGVYDRRRNRSEAEYVAEMVRSLLLDETGHTIGIVAFSEAQQDEVEQALFRLAKQDSSFGERLDEELERENDGQFVGLLVKNLENIQGDERDIIILSICYGHPATGTMRMNFGPINKSGGEKRLNVAFTRAKQHMAVVSSIDAADITNDYNEGANCLKNYLQYSHAVSGGDAETAEQVLRRLGRRRDEPKPASTVNVVADQLKQLLVEAGYRVDSAVGHSHFRCDLAVYRQSDTAYRLGILIDGDAHYATSDVLERDLMRPRLLEAFGWQIVRVLAKDWYTDQKRVLDDIVARLASGPTPLRNSADGSAETNDRHGESRS